MAIDIGFATGLGTGIRIGGAIRYFAAQCTQIPAGANDLEMLALKKWG